MLGVTTALEAGLRCLGRSELLIGNAADRRLRLLLDGGFARSVAAPAGVDERAFAVHHLTEAIVRDALADAVRFTTVHGGSEHVTLHRGQALGHVLAKR